MTFTDLLLSQLTDVFRIGLLIALLLTMLRTRATSGTAIPLAAGVIFVAAIIPMTQGATEPLWRSIATGLLANVMILAVLMAAWALYRRVRP